VTKENVCRQTFFDERFQDNMICVADRVVSLAKDRGTTLFRAMRTDSTGDCGQMKDKRKFERFEINVPARIEIPGQDGCTIKVDLETHDLSAGGTFIELGKPLPEGCAVKIDIVLSFEELKTDADPSGSLILSTTGQVVRSGADGVAIRFNEDYEFKTRLDIFHQKVVKSPVAVE
jgi:hypothetical protein